MKQDRIASSGPELVIDQQRQEAVTAPQCDAARFPPALAGLANRAIAALNAVGRIALGDGRPLVNLDPDALLEKSRRLTGLADFGEPDFRPAFRVLMRSFEEDAQLNLLGRITVHSEMIRVLCNRLRMQQDRSRFPGIAQQQVLRPIFITGLPRSGTTFLHAILAQDPACRAPLVWEVMHPSPPPETATYRIDPRIRRTRRELSWIDVLMPDFDRCHSIDACLPQECIALTDHSFLSFVFESMYFVATYRRWHDRQDKKPAYQYHRRFLQHLQWHCPGSHWVLKAPSHLMALKALFEVYPDAQVVLTHRDPLKVLPSCASFAKVLRAPFTRSIDLVALGAEVSRRWVDSANEVTELRATLPEQQKGFCDVSYQELIRDPMAVVRGIYRHFDRELSADAENAMDRFIAENPKDKRGAHLYSLEQFGLDPALEREKFRKYTDYFDVVTER